MTEKPIAKIFMSDLHIGGSGRESDFDAEKEARFATLIEALADKYRQGSELILLGDIFDLIEQKEPPEEAIKISVQAHPKAVEALQGWLAGRNKIFYITGNHDHAVRQPDIADYLAETLIGDSDIPWGYFVIDDWYASKSFRLYAEHGNRFDPDNNHAGEAVCFGDRIVKELLRILASGEDKEYFTGKKWKAPLGLDVENPFELLNNARPRGNIILLIEALTGQGYLTENTKDDLKKRLLHLYEQNPQCPGGEKVRHRQSVLVDQRRAGAGGSGRPLPALSQ